MKDKEKRQTRRVLYPVQAPYAGLGLPALAFLLLFVLNACQQKPARPAIDEDKLVEVLIDVHVAEAAVQALRGATKDSMLNVYYGQIGEIHGLDMQEFETTMETLRNDPKYLEALYSKIMSEMERQEVKKEEE